MHPTLTMYDLESILSLSSFLLSLFPSLPPFPPSPLASFPYDGELTQVLPQEPSPGTASPGVGCDGGCRACGKVRCVGASQNGHVMKELPQKRKSDEAFSPESLA